MYAFNFLRIKVLKRKYFKAKIEISSEYNNIKLRKHLSW